MRAINEFIAGDLNKGFGGAGMLFFWITLIIEVVVFVISAVVYAKKKKWFALFLLLADLAAISYTYFSEYENFPWTKTIYRFAQVEYSANGL